MGRPATKSQLPDYVARQDIARMLNMTPQRVSQLVKKGLPKVQDGYPLVSSVHWYLEQVASSPTGNNTDTENYDERKLLILAQTKKLDLENAEKEEGLLPKDLVQSVINTMATAISEGLDALAPRISSDLISLESVEELQGALFDECRKIREQIARELELAGFDFDSSADNPTPTKKKRK